MADNDNRPPDQFTPQQRLLFQAISETIGMLQAAQMHTADMTPVFEYWAQWSRDATRTSDQQ